MILVLFLHNHICIYKINIPIKIEKAHHTMSLYCLLRELNEIKHDTLNNLYNLFLRACRTDPFLDPEKEARLF